MAALIKHSCNISCGKGSCVGRAWGRLTSVGFCTGTSVLPRWALWIYSLGSHCEPLLFLLHRGSRELRVTQQILASTSSVCKRKKQRKAFFFFFSQLCSFGISLPARNAGISVHLIPRSVQRSPLSLVGSAPRSAEAAVVVINPSAMPVLVLWSSDGVGGAVNQLGLRIPGCPPFHRGFLLVNQKRTVCILKEIRRKMWFSERK